MGPAGAAFAANQYIDEEEPPAILDADDEAGAAAAARPMRRAARDAAAEARGVYDAENEMFDVVAPRAPVRMPAGALEARLGMPAAEAVARPLPAAAALGVPRPAAAADVAAARGRAASVASSRPSTASSRVSRATPTAVKALTPAARAIYERDADILREARKIVPNRAALPDGRVVKDADARREIYRDLARRLGEVGFKIKVSAKGDPKANFIKRLNL